MTIRIAGSARTARTPAVAAIAVLALCLGACSTANGPDPGQGVNRPIHGFNEGVDKYALAPVATGWDWVLPDFAITGVTNFFDNLAMPRTFINDVLQAAPTRSAQDLGRFLINTTVGIVGLIDVASMIDIPHNREDFGQTLGRWGVPPGAYVMIPLLGPSTVRDAIALPLDFAAMPQFWVGGTAVSAGATLTNVVNTRSLYLEEVEENRQTAVDYYVFIRNAYLQNREKKVLNGEGAESRDEALYDVPDDEAADDAAEE